jgi:hypothetical protein
MNIRITKRIYKHYQFPRAIHRQLNQNLWKWSPAWILLKIFAGSCDVYLRMIILSILQQFSHCGPGDKWHGHLHLLKMQTHRPHPRSTELRSPGVSVHVQVLKPHPYNVSSKSSCLIKTPNIPQPCCFPTLDKRIYLKNILCIWKK